MSGVDNVTDPLASGYKVDGLAAFVSTSTASVVSWIAGEFTEVDPKFGVITGALLGAMIYLIYSKIRYREIQKQLRENENLRKEMFGTLSSTLLKVGTSSKEWNKIRLEIASSILNESNQRILELELIIQHDISENPELEDKIVKLLERVLQDSQADRFELERDGALMLNNEELPGSDTFSSEISSTSLAVIGEKKVEEALRSLPEIVEIEQDFSFGRYRADFVVKNKKDETFIVEVKHSRNGRYPHVLRQIEAMISESPFRLSSDKMESKTTKLAGGSECRIFVAKIIPFDED